VTRLAAALLCVLAYAAEASARSELLLWTHSEPSTVTSFSVNWRQSSGPITVQAAGLPTPNAQGQYSFTVNVPDGVDVFFTVTASNDGGDSFPSNEICRGPSPGVACSSGSGGGGTGGGTGGEAGIYNFKLWDANTDTVIDADFIDGEVITNGCVAIEIVGNPYLAGGSGSLLKQLDGGSGSCENNPQFGWEDDVGMNQFNCATSLTTNKSYTLAVTPYDGKNCTGTARTTVYRNFSVNLSQQPPPPPPAGQLGVPGKPYLVTE
jgi:hypothetical protein